MRIILGSGSPRRKEILENAGLSFEIIPSGREEIITKTKPEDIVCELAEMKAAEVYETADLKEKGLVIGADTVVAVDDSILGKPEDYQDAINMINSIKGRKHFVYTGVALMYFDGEKMEKTVFSAKTEVTVADMSDEEIKAYVDTKEPFDKAGAYAIQGKFARFITSISGEYNTVVGFPIAQFYQVVKEKGINIYE